MISSLKPEIEIDNMKICYLVEEALEKIQFLGKINEAEDNSSELAGFEINKLLNEQVRLEKKYAELIKERSRLKGIANRDHHKEVEDEIKIISKKLKESTKKLCRLFKENTNLDEDSKKVISERRNLLITLGDYMYGLENDSMDVLGDTILKELEDQNRLGDQLKIEQKLKAQIKVTFIVIGRI